MPPQVKKLAHDLLTPQEHFIMGSTPRIIPKKRSESWFSPIQLINARRGRQELITDVQNERSEAGVLTSPALFRGVFGRDFGLDIDLIALTVEPLDIKSGKTIRDPSVCRWNEQGQKWVVDEDLTIQFYSRYKEDLDTLGVPFRDRGIIFSPEGNGPPTKER